MQRRSGTERETRAGARTSIPKRRPVREDVNVGCGGANLLDAAGVLFHGYLLRGRLKAKEGLYVQAGGLLKARPVPVVWMHLRKNEDKSPLFFVCLFLCGNCI